MIILLPLLLGFIISFVGTMLPGLINMTAAKISLREGRTKAKNFAFGATVVVFLQTYIAVGFSKFINERPHVIALLQEVGLGIFVALTLYFLFFAKKPKVKDKELKNKSKTGRFFFGMLLSALNFFPIPYYVFVSITLSTYGIFLFERLFLFLFVLGVVCGSYTVFYLYIFFFHRIQGKADFFMKNINYFIGSVTGLISILTLIKVLRNL